MATTRSASKRAKEIEKETPSEEMEQEYLDSDDEKEELPSNPETVETRRMRVFPRSFLREVFSESILGESVSCACGQCFLLLPVSKVRALFAKKKKL